MQCRRVCCPITQRCFRGRHCTISTVFLTKPVQVRFALPLGCVPGDVGQVWRAASWKGWVVCGRAAEWCGCGSGGFARSAVKRKALCRCSFWPALRGQIPQSYSQRRNRGFIVGVVPFSNGTTWCAAASASPWPPTGPVRSARLENVGKCPQALSPFSVDADMRRLPACQHAYKAR